MNLCSFMQSTNVVIWSQSKPTSSDGSADSLLCIQWANLPQGALFKLLRPICCPPFLCRRRCKPPLSQLPPFYAFWFNHVSHLSSLLLKLLCSPGDRCCFSSSFLPFQTYRRAGSCSSCCRLTRQGAPTAEKHGRGFRHNLIFVQCVRRIELAAET